jgi:translation elongation factor EF-Tu-like GTPase
MPILAEKNETMKMVVESAMWVTGRGLIVSGKTKGQPTAGHMLQIIRPGRETWEKKCIGIECFAMPVNKEIERPIGILLSGVKTGDILPGDTVVF